MWFERKKRKKVKVVYSGPQREDLKDGGAPKLREAHGEYSETPPRIVSKYFPYRKKIFERVHMWTHAATNSFSVTREET